MLKAVLSLTDVFTLAVSRIDPKQPYTLARRATVPTFAEAENANHVGFTYKSDTGGLVAQCWIKPGVKFRLKTDQETSEHTLAADRATTTIVTRKGNASVTYETSYAVVANQVKTTDRYPTGTVKEYSSDLDPQDFAMNGDPPSQFTGYLCKD
jgi:hypothetical protein